MTAYTITVPTEQDSLDRMARNRAQPARRMGSLAYPATVPGPPPEAFRDAVLTQAVQDARDSLARADCARRAAVGRVAKEKLRGPVSRARVKLVEAEHALAAELRGAEMADAVMRTDQVGPIVPTRVRTGEMRDGKHVVRIQPLPVTLRQAQVVVTARGRVEQVTALGRLVRDKSLTPAQGAALIRYREAHEAAASGLYGTGLNPDAVGGGSSIGGNARIENAAADGIMLSRMRSALFPRGVALVEHVVVHGLTVTSWALRQVSDSRTGMNPARAMGLLEAAADVLAAVK